MVQCSLKPFQHAVSIQTNDRNMCPMMYVTKRSECPWPLSTAIIKIAVGLHWRCVLACVSQPLAQTEPETLAAWVTRCQRMFQQLSSDTLQLTWRKIARRHLNGTVWFMRMHVQCIIYLHTSANFWSKYFNDMCWSCCQRNPPRHKGKGNGWTTCISYIYCDRDDQRSHNCNHFSSRASKSYLIKENGLFTDFALDLVAMISNDCTQY